MVIDVDFELRFPTTLSIDIRDTLRFNFSREIQCHGTIHGSPDDNLFECTDTYETRVKLSIRYFRVRLNECTKKNSHLPKTG